ncbi:MAG: hypothetical protein GYA86_10030 [Firmicutes bacterium]|nr:hypothetical protein [Bacillota bacterium]
MMQKKTEPPQGSAESGDGGPSSGGEGAPEKAREIAGTVAALRLDAVLALGFGLSRSRAVLLIRGGLVEVNGCPVEAPACRLKEGDRLSVERRGSVQIAALTGESRKGRQRIKLYKFY